MEENNALKSIEANCIRWYDFKENAKILAIGSDWKEIGEKSWTILDENAGNLAEKFDYILVKDKMANLKIAKQCLKPGGTILLFMNNRFGIANFAGADDFQSICEENSELLSKNEIEDFLKKEGFSDYKFFYPLPRYEIANAIFSDDYLPEYHHSKLMNRNLYNENAMLVFDELKALKQITKSGEFKNFANSYLIEINPKTKIQFASFNHARKKEFRLYTKVYGDYVVKEATNPESQKHIENMRKNIQDLKEHGFEILDCEENGKVISPYISEPNFYQVILETIQNGKIEEAYALIEKWFALLKTNFAKDCQKAGNLTIVKCAYIDLVFENTFLREEKFAFFDQEWTMEDAPLEFILYRAIHNIYVYHSEIEQKIPKNEFFQRFDLLEYLEVFEKIEKQIQEIIMDDAVIQMYQKSSQWIEDIQTLKEKRDAKEKMKLLEIEETKKEEYIAQLTKEKGDFEAKVKLLETEETKKEKYIQSLTKEKDNWEARAKLLEVEEKKKENYIEQLKAEIESQRDQFKIADEQKEENIRQLNEILTIKDHEIEVYENMKAVKLAKKLKGNKNGKE